MLRQLFCRIKLQIAVTVYPVSVTRKLFRKCSQLVRRICVLHSAAVELAATEVIIEVDHITEEVLGQVSSSQADLALIRERKSI